MPGRQDTLHFRIVGLQRAGNHAIISWLMNQYPNRSKCFLNNVSHVDGDLIGSADSVETELGQVPEYEIAAVRRSRPEIVVVSYEDDARKMKSATSFFDSVYTEDREEQLVKVFGRPDVSFEIIVLRDPYNFFASRIARLRELEGVKDLYEIRESWKRLAERCIESIDPPVETRLWVSFNDWFADEGYRRQLSRRIKGSFSDASLQLVSGLGGGSSFDGTAYGSRLDWNVVKRNWKKLLEPSRYLRIREYVSRLSLPGARSMKVLERWRAMRDHEEFRDVLDDDQLVSLSTRLFGEIPGTGSLRSVV